MTASVPDVLTLAVLAGAGRGGLTRQGPGHAAEPCCHPPLRQGGFYCAAARLKLRLAGNFRSYAGRRHRFRQGIGPGAPAAVFLETQPAGETLRAVPYPAMP